MARGKRETPAQPRVVEGPPASSDGIEQMQAKVEQLQTKVAVLEKEVTGLRASLPEEQVILLRTVSREQATQEIRELFQSGQTLYYSDIARRLRLDLPLVVVICQELQHAEEIEVNANAV